MGLLPERPADAKWWETCSTCAMTSDLGWARMNISYDHDTGVIEQISCG